MPPKSVRCCVCNSEVLKAHTLARKDGSRACRSHEGVVNESAKALAEQKAMRDLNMVEHAKAKRFGNAHRHVDINKLMKEANQWRAHLENHCWVCDVEGISLQEFYANALITIKRLQLRGEFNFLTMGQDIARLNPGLTVVAALPYDERTMGHVHSKIKDYKVRDLLPLIQYVRLCMPCVHKLDLQKTVEDMHPKPTVEQIQSMAVVVDGLDPVLTELAEKKERQS